MKMEQKILLRAGMKRHKTELFGVFVLLLIVSLSLASLLSVWYSGSRYLGAEMERMGYGSLTAWVSDVPDTATLTQEIAALPETEHVGVQSLLFSSYRIDEQESDSEGQLIGYDPATYSYKIFNDDLSGYRESVAEIQRGEVYISPSLVSMFGVQIGDEIAFPITRGDGTRAFTVSGYFEDPFMGSSMIGMKSFLISEQDRIELSEISEAAGIDALARSGAMLHIFSKVTSAAELSGILNAATSLPQYSEFTHSATTLSGFMLVLQNAFTGFLLAFVAVLLLVAMVVLGHSIGSAIEQDYGNIGILKSMGFTAEALRRVQLAQYLLPILCGIALGLLGSIPLTGAVNRMMLTTSGMLLPNYLPIESCALAFAAILFLLTTFIIFKTARISGITPLQAIRGIDAEAIAHRATPIKRRGLPLWMALRQLATGKRQYASACVVAMLLVFFASLMGRMNAWLGPNGEGMMNAFNPADLDIAVQPLGEVEMSEIEAVIAGISPISDQYELAMPSVALNGTDYTANIITEPERFHILEGRTCMTDDEVVLTEFVAADLGISIGDVVILSAGAGSGTFTVSGIYQCANDMGANIGLSREGYLRIGEDNPQMWCVHYFLEDSAQQATVMKALDATFGHDLHIHENTWPGLQGIISAMRMLLALMYAVVAVFILVVTALTGSKLLAREQKDISIYQALGFSARQLRLSFALRFGVVSLLGATVGVLFSGLATDPLVSAIMRLCGISSFSSALGLGSVLFPAIIILCLFTAFSYLAAGKIKKMSLTALIAAG